MLDERTRIIVQREHYAGWARQKRHGEQLIALLQAQPLRSEQERAHADRQITQARKQVAEAEQGMAKAAHELSTLGVSPPAPDELPG
jgi:hypothetical protein